MEWERDELRFLRRARVHPDLAVGQVGELGGHPVVILLLLGRRGDCHRCCDAEGEGDRGECRPGSGLVAGEVTQRQARADRGVSGGSGEDADREWAQEQGAEDRRHDPGDDERHSVSVGQCETADTDRDQRRGRDRRVACGPRLRRTPRKREQGGEAGDRSPWPPGGCGSPEDGEEDDHREQRPRKAEPVDAMAHRGFESRREDDPERTARDRAEDRGDHSDDGAVRQQHEPEMLLRSPDCREHAELAEPTLRDDSEARGGNQRGQEQEDGGDGEHCERVCGLDLAAAPRSPEARTAVLGQGVCEGAELLFARVDQNGDVLRRPG